MAFIPVPNVAKVTLQWVWAGQIVELTLAFKKASAIGTADLNALNTAMHSWYTTEIRPLQTSQCSLRNINSTDQTTSSAPSVDLPITPAEAGGGGFVSVATNVASVCTFTTDSRGRSFRGRSYLPGIPGGQQDSPVSITPGWVGLQTAAMAALTTYVTGPGFEHVVMSRFAGGVARAPGIATTVTGYRGELLIDSQRRRLAGRGI